MKINLMSKFIIKGGKKLKGEIRVSGSKNAVLPLMAACLLTEGECIINNTPRIKDVQTMASLLSDLGAKVSVDGSRVVITAEKLFKTEIKAELAGRLRGSVLLLGPLLARMKKTTMVFPGGDLIGKRPVDAHLSAFKDLGAVIKQNGSIELSCHKLIGNKIVLEESSVTATENALMAASIASGKTVIKLAAMEPHASNYANF